MLTTKSCKHICESAAQSTYPSIKFIFVQDEKRGERWPHGKQVTPKDKEGKKEAVMKLSSLSRSV